MDGATFRGVMSGFAGAVNIVATGQDGDRTGWRGLTATAVCSLSVDPASVLVCLNRDSGTYERLSTVRRLSVNLLATRHVALARTFAGHGAVHGADRFGEEWAPGVMGVPVLRDALASLECELSLAVEHATHVVLIGAVERATRDEGEPLVYHRQSFRGLGDEVDPAGGSAA